jgi:glutamate carboxypeptidase
MTSKTRERTPEVREPRKIEPSPWLEDTKKRKKGMLEQLEALVSIESPSDDKVAVDLASRVMADWFETLGGKIIWHRQKLFGDLLEVRFRATSRSSSDSKSRIKPILLLGHLDTVWPMGTLATMPYRVSKGKIFGPGVYDMKAGVIMALYAMTMLVENRALTTPVVVLFVSEEEVGSPVSRAVTEKIARECSAVFVLEPAQGAQGAYKTARKGVGDYSVRVQGVAAHSGVDFEKGHSAVLELARLIEKISQFTDLKTGLTVNPGTIWGGTRTNVIAAEAQAEVDVRIARMRDAARVERLFRGLRTSNRACKLTITGGLNRPPMERSRGTVALFQQAKALARAMGFGLEEASTGGGSDGNFTAALGIPTLDGMGAVGEGAHAGHESIVVDDLMKRTALLAAMIAR